MKFDAIPLSHRDGGPGPGGQHAAKNAQCRLDLLEAGYIKNAAERGEQLRAGLRKLREQHPEVVGEVRGLGLMAAVELAEDRKTRKLLDPKRETAKKVVTMARDMGLYTRAIGDRISLSPPFVTPDDVIDRIPAILYDCIAEVTGK